MTTQDYIFIGFFIVVLLFKIVIPLVKKWYMQANSRLGRYSRFTTEPSEIELRKLLWMSNDKLPKEPISDNNAKEIVEDTIALSQKLQSYCSLNILFEFTNKKLQHRDFVSMYRRMDFVAPDKFHVSQDAWDVELGEVSDEWVSSGDNNFQKVVFWMETDDRFNADVNEALKMDKYFEILRYNKPINQEVIMRDKDRYLMIVYQPPLLEKVEDMFPKCPENISCQVYLWINLDSGYFVRGELVAKENNNIVAKYVDVYACHNAKINIEPPMINTTPTEEEGVVEMESINTITIPHHS